MRILLLLVLLLVGTRLNAADTATGIFNDRFKTLEVKVDGNEMSPPVIGLNGVDRIVISFDELSDEVSYLRYSLEHCNAMWQPSGLVESEFLDGFNEGSVEDYSFSEATTVHYVHYRITLPNEDMRFTVSGNYLLKVYPENDPDDVLLQARFMVSEGSVKTAATVASITDVDYNDRHQQVSVTVDAKDVPVHNIYNDLIVMVTQNGRTDNQVYLTTPQRVLGSKAVYEHLRPLIFPAGNEYRRFENVSVNYPSMRIAETVYAAPYYHAAVETDYPRAGEPYYYDETQKGRFKVHEYSSANPEVEADYVMTHFTLEMPQMNGADVFLDGDFTGRRFNPESMMHYDNYERAYKASVLLKQGSYNYQYLVVPSGTATGTTAPVEGDYYNTSNEYLVNVYLRTPGARYDRLVGSTMIITNGN